MQESVDSHLDMAIYIMITIDRRQHRSMRRRSRRLLKIALLLARPECCRAAAPRRADGRLSYVCSAELVHIVVLRTDSNVYQ